MIGQIASVIDTVRQLGPCFLCRYALFVAGSGGGLGPAPAVRYRGAL